jgi:hypothetical protein
VVVKKIFNSLTTSTPPFPTVLCHCGSGVALPNLVVRLARCVLVDQPEVPQLVQERVDLAVVLPLGRGLHVRWCERVGQSLVDSTLVRREQGLIAQA